MHIRFLPGEGQAPGRDRDNSCFGYCSLKPNGGWGEGRTGMNHEKVYKLAVEPNIFCCMISDAHIPLSLWVFQMHNAYETSPDFFKDPKFI